MMLQDTIFAVTDVETTGTFIAKHDRVIEVAIKCIDWTGNHQASLVSLINAERDIGDAAIHGIQAERLLDAPEFQDVAARIVELFRNAVFVAHNARFDQMFLEAEFVRIGAPLPSMPRLCTMQLARSAFGALPSRDLASLCWRLGILNSAPHTAEGDVDATIQLLLRCFHDIGVQANWHLDRIGVDRELAGTTEWPKITQSARPLTRRAASSMPSRSSGIIRRLLNRLPATGECDEACDAYLECLDRVLEDRIVSSDEAAWLLDVATDLGLTRERAAKLHREYFAGLARAAWADGVITQSERDDLRRVYVILCPDGSEFEEFLTSIGQEADIGTNLAPSVTGGHEFRGCSVCFTGMLQCSIDGERISRAHAQGIARAHGMDVRDSCTKSLDILVVADPHSPSGKAKKARQYGTRIIVERAFWMALGVDVE